MAYANGRISNMNKNFLFYIFIILVTACGNSNQINAHSLATANKSVKHVKERLPNDLRLEFELSYWTLRDELKDDAAFLQALDGKNPYEIIDLGQASFDRRKAAGFTDYQRFADWQAMLSDYAKQRDGQSKPSVNADKEAKYKHSVLYNMRSPH
jgi:hypothetical protein